MYLIKVTDLVVWDIVLIQHMLLENGQTIFKICYQFLNCITFTASLLININIL